MSDNTATVNVNVTATTNDLAAGMRQNVETVRSSTHEIERQFSEMSHKIKETIADAAKVLVGAWSVEKIKEVGAQALETAEQTNKLSQSLGVSVQTLQTMQLAAIKTQTPMEAIGSSFARLERAAVEATQGNQKLIDDFKAIGISATQLAKLIKNPDQLLQVVTGHLAGFHDAATKATVSMDLMGRGAAQNMAFINELGGSWAKLTAEADRLGIRLSGEDFDALIKTNEAIDDLKAASVGLTNQFMVALAPAITEVVEKFRSWVASGDFKASIDSLAVSAKFLAEHIELISAIIKTVVEVKLAGWAMEASVQMYSLAKAALFAGESFSTMQKSFLVVAALIAAWNIGKYLYDNFLEAQLAWLDFVGAMKKGWNQIKEGAELTLLDMKGLFADFLDGMANGLNKLSGIGWLSDKLGGPSAISAIKGVTDSLRDNGAAMDGIRKSMLDANNAVDIYTEGQKQITKIQWDLTHATTEAGKAVDEGSKKILKLGPDSKKFADELAKGEEAMKHLAEAALVMAGIAGGPLEEANNKYIKNSIELNELLKTAIENHIDAGKAMDVYTAAMKANDAQRDATIEKMKREQDIVGKLNEEFKKEESTLGLSGQALAEQQAILTASAQARDNFNNKIRDTIELTPDEIAKVREMAAEHYQLNLAVENNRKVMQDWVNIAESGLQSFGKTVSDVMTGAIKSWGDFGKSLVNDAKQMVAQIIQEFFKLKVINPILNSLFSGGAGGMSLLPTMANAAGGGMGGLGSMLGAGGSLLAPGSFLGSIFGGAELAGPPIAGAATAGTSVGMLGSIGSFLMPVGIAVAAATILNSLTGGAVFGTSWKPTGSNVNYGVSDTGATLSNQISESRKAPLFGLFGGSTHKTVNGPVDPQAQQSITDLFNGIKTALQTSSDALAVEVPTMISGSFKQVYDKKGVLKDQFSTILGQVVHESFEDFGKRLEANNILAVVAKSAGDISSIVSLFNSNASTLLAGAQFLLAAQVDIIHGNGLLGSSLEDTAKFVKAAAQGNETLIQTYARLQGATAVLQQAVDLMGVNLGKSREDFVTFAADIATAAGGLQQAQALWGDFFKNFYSSSEQAKMQLDAARKTATADLTGLGLDSNTTMAQFRAIFEAQLPTLSAEATAQWLQAAAALAAATQAQATYDQSLGTTAAAVTQTAEQMQASAQALQAARHDYQDFMNGIRLSAGTLDAFGKSLLDIQKAERDNIARANELARAAGMAGAAEADLATIHLAAARAAAQAIAELQHSASDLVSRLYGNTQDSLDSLTSSGSRAARAVSSAATSMQDFADSLLTGSLSPLNDSQKLQEGMRQLMAASAAGNVSEVQRLAQETLATGQRLYATGSDYRDLFNQVQSIVGNTHGVSTGGGGGGGDFANQANNAAAQIDPAQRALEAKQLAQMIADLAVAQGKTIEEVEKQLGVPIDKLAKDLGMSSEELGKFILSLENITSGYGTPEVHGMIAGPKPGAHTADSPPPMVSDKGDLTPNPWQVAIADKLDKLGASLDRILAGVVASGTSVANEVQDVREGITNLVSAVRQPSINEAYSRNVSRGTVLTP